MEIHVSDVPMSKTHGHHDPKDSRVCTTAYQLVTRVILSFMDPRVYLENFLKLLKEERKIIFFEL